MDIFGQMDTFGQMDIVAKMLMMKMKMNNLLMWKTTWAKAYHVVKNKHYTLLHKSSLDFEKQPKIIIISSVALKFAEVCFTLNKSELKKKYTYV